jgi:putative two-component system response regulator
LVGEEIPVLGRVMAIVDVYDALVSDRPYKSAFSHEVAMDIIQKGIGTQFDPGLIRIFLSLSERIKIISEAN